ncbi:MAG: hypothetical protein ACI3XO_09130, partial [Eubacteriales bacterium]
LDPKQIIEIRDLIKKLGSIKTVILSSHILAEISAVCDHVMIISHGRLVANDSIENLENAVNREGELSLKVRADAASVKNTLSGIKGISSASYSEEGGVTSAELKTAKGTDIRDDIFFAFAAKKLPIIEMVYRVLTLEDIFLALTDDRSAPAEIESKEKKPRPRLFARARTKDKDAEAEGADDYTPQFGGSDTDDNESERENEEEEK